jgi:predicted Zn-dependent protease
MYNIEIQDEVNELLKNNISVKEINIKTGVSLTTIKRWKKLRKTRLLIRDLINNKKYEDAMEIIDLNIEKQNIFKDVFISSKIKILLREQKLEYAEKLAREALIRCPNSRFFNGQLINSLRFQNKLEEAEKLACEALLKEPNNILQKRQLLNILYEQNKLEIAESVARELLIDQPTDKKVVKQLESILMYRNMQSPKTSNGMVVKESFFEVIRKQEYDGDSLHTSLKNVMQLKNYVVENPSDKMAIFILAEAYYKMRLKEISINTCKKIIYNPNVSLQDLKIFKNMIEIVKSNKPIFNNTKQKLNVLAKKINE